MMTQHKETPITQLDRLLDQYSTELIEASDADILERAHQAGLNPEQLAVNSRALLAKAAAQAGKQRLEAAKQARASQLQSEPSSVNYFSDAAKARAYIVSNKQRHPEDFTLAARNGEAMDDADAIRIANQLRELIGENDSK